MNNFSEYSNNITEMDAFTPFTRTHRQLIEDCQCYPAAPKFSYEYESRLIFGAKYVQNNQKKTRVKEHMDSLSFHSIDKLN